MRRGKVTVGHTPTVVGFGCEAPDRGGKFSLAYASRVREKRGNVTVAQAATVISAKSHRADRGGREVAVENRATVAELRRRDSHYGN